MRNEWRHEIILRMPSTLCCGWWAASGGKGIFLHYPKWIKTINKKNVIKYNLFYLHEGPEYHYCVNKERKIPLTHYNPQQYPKFLRGSRPISAFRLLVAKVIPKFALKQMIPFNPPTRCFNKILIKLFFKSLPHINTHLSNQQSKYTDNATHICGSQILFKIK